MTRRHPVRLAISSGVLAWLLCAPGEGMSQVQWSEHAPTAAAQKVEAPWGSVTWVAGFDAVHAALAMPFGRIEPGLLHAGVGPEACPGDLNGDQTISTTDLLILLSVYGTSSASPADFTGDGLVGTADLLVLLSVFGTSCP